MITAVRTANVQDGKIGEAIARGVKATNYLRDKTGAKVQLARNVTGILYQLHWISTHQSLADFEKEFKQMEADEGYMGLIAEARQQNLFISISIVTSLYETIA